MTKTTKIRKTLGNAALKLAAEYERQAPTMANEDIFDLGHIAEALMDIGPAQRKVVLAVIESFEAENARHLRSAGSPFGQANFVEHRNAAVDELATGPGACGSAAALLNDPDAQLPPPVAERLK